MHTAIGRAPRDLLCLSHLRWDFVFQRPQHLLSRAAAQFNVHYFEEATTEEISAPRLDVRLSAEGVKVITPLLPAALPAAAANGMVRKLLDLYLRSDCDPAIAWYYTPAALKFSRHIDFPVTVYDCMDELSHFKDAAPDLVSLEKELMQKADVVFTGGTSLYDAKKRLHHNVHAFPSSVDVGHFRPARKLAGIPPADIADIPGPRLGYFGVIDERIDYDLIDEVARRRPEWHLVMIGPTAKIDPASLPQRSNIHWLGRKSYDDLPRYLSCLDIGLMPFAINAATRFISPTKTPEYLAAGVPVVSTPITDVVRTWGSAGLVEIAADAATMIAAGERILKSDRTEWMTRVDKKLATVSWSRTWAAMRDLVRRAEARTGVGGADGAHESTVVQHV